jgi:hypothetical protein
MDKFDKLEYNPLLYVYICMVLNINELYIGNISYDKCIYYYSIYSSGINWYLSIIIYYDKNCIDIIYNKLDIHYDNLYTFFNNKQISNYQIESSILLKDDIYFKYKIIQLNNITNNIDFIENKEIICQKNEIYDNKEYYELLDIISFIH